MKRLLMAALIVGLAPVLMGAGGGANPPIPGQEQIARNPKYKAIIMIDVHPNNTTTAGQGTVTIRTDKVSSTGPIAAGFVFLQGFSLGCQTGQALTEQRFVDVRLVEIMPTPFDVIKLFAPFGEVVSLGGVIPLRSPIITDVKNPFCTGTADPADDAVDGPGIQVFEATIQFVVPATQ
jgi:hypothetical protein